MASSDEQQRRSLMARANSATQSSLGKGGGWAYLYVGELRRWSAGLEEGQNCVVDGEVFELGHPHVEEEDSSVGAPVSDGHRGGWQRPRPQWGARKGVRDDSFPSRAETRREDSRA
uniref:Uncharacterized protein n=1 Tax=Arundo donax TaxID=35708 RepID=A0A0A9DMA5_ARUDO